MNEDHIIIFTDGSSRGNPGPGGWAAIAAYPKANGEMRVDELGGSEAHTTNNKMEMTAAIKALRNFDNFYPAGEEKEFVVYTDSSYLINGITKWVHCWQRNGWMTTAKEPVLNDELWQELVDAVSGKKISWRQVKGHADTAGNNRCDEIATMFADGVKVELYKGSLAGYKFDMLAELQTRGATSSLSSKSKSFRSKTAYSYVSKVDGKIETHASWVDTEKRVKGKSGAKYKKAMSKEDESVIIDDFST
jgi:ribonuclease HI